MEWQYGFVKTQLHDGSDWYYLAEIYSKESHTEKDYLGGISGESPQECIEMLEIILFDLKVNLLVIDEVVDVSAVEYTGSGEGSFPLELKPKG